MDVKSLKSNLLLPLFSAVFLSLVFTSLGVCSFYVQTTRHPLWWIPDLFFLPICSHCRPKYNHNSYSSGNETYRPIIDLIAGNCHFSLCVAHLASLRLWGLFDVKGWSYSIGKEVSLRYLSLWLSTGWCTIKCVKISLMRPKRLTQLLKVSSLTAKTLQLCCR